MPLHHAHGGTTLHAALLAPLQDEMHDVPLGTQYPPIVVHQLQLGFDSQLYFEEPDAQEAMQAVLKVQ